MAKKSITVIIEGTINEKLKKDFHDRLACILVDQYGIEGAAEILKAIKGQTSK